MAGSLKWMLYTDDAGNRHAVKIDESNGEALGFDDYTGGTGEASTPIPRGWQMRGVNCVNTDGIRRFFPVGKVNNDIYTGAQNSFTAAGDTWQVSSPRGEKRPRAVAFDTGRDDGDAT